MLYFFFLMSRCDCHTPLAIRRCVSPYNLLGATRFTSRPLPFLVFNFQRTPSGSDDFHFQFAVSAVEFVIGGVDRPVVLLRIARSHREIFAFPPESGKVGRPP